MIESASVVVNQPLPVVEAMVRDVSSWTALFGDVEDVSRLARDRYVVQVRQGRRVRPALLRVHRQAAEHRVSWRTLSGPAWSGELHLLALTGHRTMVRLSLDRTPHGAGSGSQLPAGLPDQVPGRPWDGLPGWVRTVLPRLGRTAWGRPGNSRVTGDLRRLCERGDALPRPVRPQRLGPLPGARPVEDVLIIEGMCRRPGGSGTE